MLKDRLPIKTPKRQAQAPEKAKAGPDLARWHSTRIRVNTFKTEEWPFLETLSYSNLSIGEEQSLSTVCALSWSEAAIGRHRRYVLAVLTTNLILSIWETNGEEGGWARVLVVNDALEDYLRNLAHGEELQRRKRVRTFEWNPRDKFEVPGLPDDLLEAKGLSLLAITNDSDEVICIRLQRRGFLALQNTPWQAEAFSHVPLTRPPDRRPFEPDSLFAEAMATGSLTWNEVLQSHAEFYVSD